MREGQEGSGTAETARRITSLALDNILTDFGNHRWESSPQKTVGSLAEDISEEGLLHPPVVRPHPQKEGCYQVIVGHRRVMAARLLGWSVMDAEVREVEQDSEVRRLQMAENLHHMALSPIEEAIGIEAMVRLDRKTQKQVAGELGFDPAEVKRRLDLLKLSGRVVEELHTGRLKPAHGNVLYRHLKGDESLQEEFAARAVEEKLSAELLERYVKERLDGEAEDEEELLEVRIPPMGPTPTTVYHFAEGVLPEEGREGEATDSQRDLYVYLDVVAKLKAFGDHELRSTELGLPVPYVPADVGDIYSYVFSLSVEEADELSKRLTRRFFEAGHRAKLMPRQLVSTYMEEGLSAAPAGSEKGLG